MLFLATNSAPADAFQAVLNTQKFWGNKSKICVPFGKHQKECGFGNRLVATELLCHYPEVKKLCNNSGDLFYTLPLQLLGQKQLLVSL